MDDIIAKACDISPHLKDLMREMVKDAPDAVEHAKQMRKVSLSFIRSQSALFCLAMVGVFASLFIGELRALDCVISASFATMAIACLGNVVVFFCDAVATKKVLMKAMPRNLKQGMDVVEFHMAAARMFRTLGATYPYQKTFLAAAKYFNIGALICVGINGIRTLTGLLR